MRAGPIVLVLGWLLISGPANAQQDAPAGPVPVAALAQRRALLLDRIGDGVVVLKATRVQDMEGEDFPQATDFRQDDDFFYLTGLETPRAWLVLNAHSHAPDQVTLYIQPRDETEEPWTGARLSTADAAAQSGIRDVRSIETVASDVAALLSASSQLYVKLPGAARETCDQLASARQADCDWLFLQPLKPRALELRDVRPQLAALRLVKDDDELRRMRRAIAITDDALRYAMQHYKPGAWEYEIEAGIEAVFHAGGAERVGFPTIVGSGPNSTTLHYDKSRRRTQPGDLVVLDIGAEYGYYTADVTRTMPISGKFTARQRAIYDLVLGAQQAALDSVRPGMTLPRLDDIARAYLQQHSGTLCGNRTCDDFFIHGVGHWLGMDVHDPGMIGTAFTAGMVLTIEPGVYLPAEQLGVRIEDDVLVTSTGHELLSGDAPRRAQDVERLMAGEATSAK
jgi:Xaa-Pro aminopeptidase